MPSSFNGQDVALRTPRCGFDYCRGCQSPCKLVTESETYRNLRTKELQETQKKPTPYENGQHGADITSDYEEEIHYVNDAGLTQLAEYDPYKIGAAGSSPASRTKCAVGRAGRLHSFGGRDTIWYRGSNPLPRARWGCQCNGLTRWIVVPQIGVRFSYFPLNTIDFFQILCYNNYRKS